MLMDTLLRHLKYVTFVLGVQHLSNSPHLLRALKFVLLVFHKFLGSAGHFTLNVRSSVSEHFVGPG